MGKVSGGCLTPDSYLRTCTGFKTCNVHYLSIGGGRSEAPEKNNQDVTYLYIDVPQFPCLLLPLLPSILAHFSHFILVELVEDVTNSQR